MGVKVSQPAAVDGIEFDMLDTETVTYTSDIPQYPVEDGFSVSDTISFSPYTVQLELYATDTPVTWLGRHGASFGRAKRICDQIRDKYFERKLITVTTSSNNYTDMGITSLAIANSSEIGYAYKITLGLRKVYVTQRKVAAIPIGILKSGSTSASAGKSKTSTSSSTASGKKAASGTSSANTSSSTKAKNTGSVLYGLGTKYGLIK